MVYTWMMWPWMQRMTTKSQQFYGGDYKYLHARRYRLDIPNHTKQSLSTKPKCSKETPNLPGQIYSTKLTKPKPTKTNIPHQTNQIKHRKPNIGILVLKGIKKCFWEYVNSCITVGTLLGLTDLIRCKEFRKYPVWNSFLLHIITVLSCLRVCP